MEIAKKFYTDYVNLGKLELQSEDEKNEIINTSI